MRKFPLGNMTTAVVASQIILIKHWPSDFYICTYLILTTEYEAGFSSNTLHTEKNTENLIIHYYSHKWTECVLRKKIFHIIQLIAFEIKTKKASPLSGVNPV